MDHMIITSTRQLSQLLDGTVVSPTEDCAWPEFFHGRSYLKRGAMMYEVGGSGGNPAILLSTFKDTLPARVTGHLPVLSGDIFGEPLQVGDLVLPEDYREFEHAFLGYELRVTHVFKNGKVRATTPSRNATYDGPASMFYRPTFPSKKAA